MIEAIAAAATAVTSLGVNVWLIVKYARAVDHAASVEVAQAHSEGEQTRLVFELETVRSALTESQRRNRILAEALNAEIARNPNADLADDDVASRMRRLEVRFSAEGDLSAVDHGGTVFADPAPAPPKAGDLRGEPATELR